MTYMKLNVSGDSSNSFAEKRYRKCKIFVVLLTLLGVLFYFVSSSDYRRESYVDNDAAEAYETLSAKYKNLNTQLKNKPEVVGPIQNTNKPKPTPREVDVVYNKILNETKHIMDQSGFFSTEPTTTTTKQPETTKLVQTEAPKLQETPKVLIEPVSKSVEAKITAEVPKPQETPKPPEVANPVEAEASKPVEAPKSPEVVKSVEAQKVAEVPKPVEEPKSPEVAKPVEAQTVAEVPKSVETPKSPEVAKQQKQMDAEAPKPVEVSKSTEDVKLVETNEA